MPACLEALSLAVVGPLAPLGGVCMPVRHASGARRLWEAVGVLGAYFEAIMGVLGQGRAPKWGYGLF